MKAKPLSGNQDQSSTALPSLTGSSPIDAELPRRELAGRDSRFSLGMKRGDEPVDDHQVCACVEQGRSDDTAGVVEAEAPSDAEREQNHQEADSLILGHVGHADVHEREDSTGEQNCGDGADE